MQLIPSITFCLIIYETTYLSCTLEYLYLSCVQQAADKWTSIYISYSTCCTNSLLMCKLCELFVIVSPITDTKAYPMTSTDISQMKSHPYAIVWDLSAKILLVPITLAPRFICFHQVTETDVFTRIVDLSLSSGFVAINYTIATVGLLIKQPSLDPQILRKYRPVSNLPFISKILEQVIKQQLLQHLEERYLFEKSAISIQIC